MGYKFWSDTLVNFYRGAAESILTYITKLTWFEHGPEAEGSTAGD